MAEQETVVVPSGNVAPEAGVHATETLPLTRSVAVAVNVTAAPDEPVASTVMFAGRCNVGAVLSETVTLKLPVARLPAVSVAEQETVVVPSGNVAPEAGVHATETLPLTRSVAVAVNVTAAPDEPVASTVMFDGRCNVGGVVFVTVTVKLPLALWPAASRAEHVTVVVPSANVLPEAGAHVGTTLPSTRSVAVAVNVTAAPDGPVAGTVMSAGRCNAGPVVSETVTVKLPVARLPAASAAEQETVVVPSGNVAPEAGMHATETLPLTRSVAVAVNVTAAPDEPVASTVMFDGRCNVGAVLSETVTLKLPLAVLAAASEAEHETVVDPSGNVAPDVGAQLTGTTPSTRSVAEAVNVTAAPAGPVASTVMFPGSVSVGGSVSASSRAATPTEPDINWSAASASSTTVPIRALLMSSPSCHPPRECREDRDADE